MRAGPALSASALIRLRLIGGNRKNSTTVSRCFPIPRQKLFAVTGAGPKGADIAQPAEFLIDSNGMIRWVNLTENIAVRARPEQVLDAFNRAAIDGASPSQYLQRTCIPNWNNCSFFKIDNKRSDRFRLRSKRCRCNAIISSPN